MNRIALEDGRWFDADRAKRWGENTRFDGNNHISVNTGSQWTHEVLYLTAGGTWVLNWWSQWLGGKEIYSVVSDGEAARWLIRNGHLLPDRLAGFETALEV